MSAFKGDFLGFTYGGVHSSDLGIVRTSDGSRFNENLLPTQQNRTVNIPGRDETYFFGSDNTQRQFSVSFAFDLVTQTQLNQMRQLFGGKDIKDLKFDERGNITWKAKVTASSIKYIPFDLLNIKDRYILPVKDNWLYVNIISGAGNPTITDYNLPEYWYLNTSTLELWYLYKDKTSWTKMSTSSSLKAIDRGSVAYKGEGTLQFTCYQPYGITSTQVKGNSAGYATVSNSLIAATDWEMIIAGVPAKVTWEYNDVVGSQLTIDSAGIIDYYAEKDITITGLMIDSRTGFVKGLYSTTVSNGDITKYTIASDLCNQYVTGNIQKMPANKKVEYDVDWPSGTSPIAVKLVYKTYHY